MRNTYTQERLNECMSRDGAKLVGEYTSLNRNSRITFICKCGNQHNKEFRKIYEKTNALCRKCTYAIKLEKQTNTNLQLYGVSNVFQDEEIKRKSKETLVTKTGYDSPMKNPEIRQKAAETSLANHGFKHALQNPDFKKKAEETTLKNYGVRKPLQSKEIREKMSEKYFEKTGFHHPLQNPEVYDRVQEHSYQTKPFTMPSGKIRNIRGYEHFALKTILEINQNEDDIITLPSKMPLIYYTKENKKHRYYGDIFIPSLHKFIEVKSEYTLSLKSGNIDEKAQACVDAGYKYEIWVYNDKGSLLQTIIYS
jgi:hypothetical protein